MAITAAPTDARLFDTARHGDKRALATLVGRHYPALLRICRHTVGDAELARDAAQEAVLRPLPIWIGAAEATALAVLLEDVALPRPGVYRFAASLLAATGRELREVRITKLTEAVFYAEAVLSDGSVVDARPSDALTLALVTGARVTAAGAVLKQVTDAGDERLADAEQAPDDARTIAAEVRDQQARRAAELAARHTPPV